MRGREINNRKRQRIRKPDKLSDLFLFSLKTLIDTLQKKKQVYNKYRLQSCEEK